MPSTLSAALFAVYRVSMLSLPPYRTWAWESGYSVSMLFSLDSLSGWQHVVAAFAVAAFAVTALLACMYRARVLLFVSWLGRE